VLTLSPSPGLLSPGRLPIPRGQRRRTGERALIAAAARADVPRAP